MNDWHKSHYSGGATNCVEVRWTKSSYSSGATNCVECRAGEGVVHVRDTQHRHLGSLSVPTEEWRAFVHALKADEL